MWTRYGRSALSTLVAVYVPLGVLLVAVKLAAVDQHASALIEPAWSPGESLARGSLWAAGLAGWGWAFGAAVIGWATSRRRTRGSSRERGRFLLGAAAVSALMFADDLWQLHDPRIPDTIGLSSGVVLVVYGGLVGWWLWASRTEIARTDAGILAVALGFFVVWLAAKGMPGVPERVTLAAGAKLGGIAGWAAYLTRTAVVGVGRHTPTPRREGAPGPA